MYDFICMMPKYSCLIRLLRWIGGLLATMWDWLPQVRPYTGPQSLEHRADERCIMFQGRVVVMKRLKI